ncbi:MAG: riboflavin kinase, partial [Proteobacteria bacterium]|nr:riboflavin kinase [Pseudomonadota bacterium]
GIYKALHLLFADAMADRWPQLIRVNMVARLRDEQKFSSIQELSEQIRTDIQIAKDILNNDPS